MYQEHRPREETRQIIMQTVTRSNRPVTRTQIARALNRRKTPHLNQMIDNLVEEGILSRSIVTFHNGVEGYGYTISEDEVFQK